MNIYVIYSTKCFDLSLSGGWQCSHLMILHAEVYVSDVILLEYVKLLSTFMKIEQNDYRLCTGNHVGPHR